MSARQQQVVQGLDAWVERLNRVELPVLGSVMQEISTLTRDSDTSANELAAVILKDAGLTTKVLRLANSVHFNPQPGQEITTISRAVVKLGFQGIKAICLSAMLIDSLLRKGSRERMLEWLGRGFHAAVQAEQLAQKAGVRDAEDVFVAALLLHVGDMAFWSCRGSESERLDLALPEHSGASPGVEQDVLGTTLHAISCRLAQLWGLGDTLVEALQREPGTATPRARAVLLGEAVSLAAERDWDSAEMAAVVREAAAFCGMDEEGTRTLLLAGADRAAGVAVSFGANKVCRYIPSTEAGATPRSVQVMRPNPRLQLDVLRELTSLIRERVDANTLFQLMVEGVHRGIGLERVALLLMDPRRKLLAAKYCLGERTGHWREALQLPAKGEQDNLFAACLLRREEIWLRPGERHALAYLMDDTCRRQVSADNLLLAPIWAGNRPIGVLLADRGDTGLAIDEEQRDSFCHFAEQTGMGLALLAERAR